MKTSTTGPACKTLNLHENLFLNMMPQCNFDECKFKGLCKNFEDLNIQTLGRIIDLYELRLSIPKEYTIDNKGTPEKAKNMSYDAMRHKLTEIIRVNYTLLQKGQADEVSIFRIENIKDSSESVTQGIINLYIGDTNEAINDYNLLHKSMQIQPSRLQ